MFERFDDAARRVVILAQDDARKLNHSYIGTEHLLLGLLRREGQGVATTVLTGLGVTYDAVLHQVERTVGRGATPPGGHIPFTESAKVAMQHSLQEALGLRYNVIGTPHILLGLLRGEGDTAARILTALGADADRVREQVLGSLK